MGKRAAASGRGGARPEKRQAAAKRGGCERRRRRNDTPSSSSESEFESSGTDESTARRFKIILKCVVVIETLVRQHSSASSWPDVPRSFEELQRWSQHVWGRCLENKWDASWAQGGDLVLTCKWAGLGGMPIGFNYIVDGIKDKEHPALSVKFFSFADNDSTCQGNALG